MLTTREMVPPTTAPQFLRSGDKRRLLDVSDKSEPRDIMFETEACGEGNDAVDGPEKQETQPAGQSRGETMAMHNGRWLKERNRQGKGQTHKHMKLVAPSA